MKTKLDRKNELIAISKKPSGLLELRDLLCNLTGQKSGYVPQSEIGKTTSEYITEILDQEFPEDDSTPSRQ